MVLFNIKKNRSTETEMSTHFIVLLLWIELLKLPLTLLCTFPLSYRFHGLYGIDELCSLNNIKEDFRFNINRHGFFTTMNTITKPLIKIKKYI